MYTAVLPAQPAGVQPRTGLPTAQLSEEALTTDRAPPLHALQVCGVGPAPWPVTLQTQLLALFPTPLAYGEGLFCLSPGQVPLSLWFTCFSGNHCPPRPPCEPFSCEHETCLTSFLSFLMIGIDLSLSCEYYYSKLCVHSVQPHLPGFPLCTHTHTHALS